MSFGYFFTFKGPPVQELKSFDHSSLTPNHKKLKKTKRAVLALQGIAKEALDGAEGLKDQSPLPGYQLHQREFCLDISCTARESF